MQNKWSENIFWRFWSLPRLSFKACRWQNLLSVAQNLPDTFFQNNKHKMPMFLFSCNKVSVSVGQLLKIQLLIYVAFNWQVQLILTYRATVHLLYCACIAIVASIFQKLLISTSILTHQYFDKRFLHCWSRLKLENPPLCMHKLHNKND